MKVLLGVGGGPDSLVTLPTVVERAAALGDDLTVAILDQPGADPADPELRTRVQEALSGASVEADIRVLDGDPGSELVALAESEGFDVVALGGGRETPMGKISVGEVAEYVILNARVSVFLVR